MARVPTSRMTRPPRPASPIPASLSPAQASQERAHWAENWVNRQSSGRDSSFYEMLDGSVTHLRAARPFDPTASTNSFSILVDLEVANNVGTQTVFEFQNVNPFRMQLVGGLIRFAYRTTTGTDTKTGAVEVFSNGARRWVELRYNDSLNTVEIRDKETEETIETLNFNPAIPAIPWVGTNFQLDIGLRTNNSAPLLGAKFYSLGFYQDNGSPLLVYDLPDFDDKAGVNAPAATTLAEV